MIFEYIPQELSIFAASWRINMRDLKEAEEDAKLTVKKPITSKSVEVIANSIYNILRQEGCEEKDIIGVSSQLIGLVASSFETEEE
jgi:hypothetical protein